MLRNWLLESVRHDKQARRMDQAKIHPAAKDCLQMPQMQAIYFQQLMFALSCSIARS